MTKEAKLLKKLALDPSLARGVFFPPHVFAIESMSELKREVFGPILHVVRFAADRLDAVCDSINASLYGLTLGLHSRIDETAEFVRERVRVGNIYVNRNQIGADGRGAAFRRRAAVGHRPQGGGPHYLPRFAVERTLTINSAAAGGNANLLTLDEA